MSKPSATFSSSFSYSSSSSTSNSNGQVTGQRESHQTYTDPQGNTTVKSSSQNLGQPVVENTRHYDSSGQERIGGGGVGASRRIEDVSDDAQAQRDLEYEERMEDEYAKREGGA